MIMINNDHADHDQYKSHDHVLDPVLKLGRLYAVTCCDLTGPGRRAPTKHGTALWDGARKPPIATQRPRRSSYRQGF